MNKETLLEITTNVLNVGYSDLEYLANKIEEYTATKKLDRGLR